MSGIPRITGQELWDKAQTYGDRALNAYGMQRQLQKDNDPGKTAGGAIMSGVGGAGAGATIGSAVGAGMTTGGSAAGPYGAAIGAVVGLAANLLA